VDDLDLDASLADAVTVVEWGEGLVEQLTASRLEIRLRRPHGSGQACGHLGGGDDGDEPRTVEITAIGPRWDGVDLAADPAGVG